MYNVLLIQIYSNRTILYKNKANRLGHHHVVISSSTYHI